MIPTIYFWQRTVTPHMAYLAEETAKLGYSVTYVANQILSPSRKNMGWNSPSLEYAHLVILSDCKSVVNFVRCLPIDSIHLCQGIRANKLVGVAQNELSRRGLRQWIIMEKPNDLNNLRHFRNFIYSRLFLRKQASIQGFLAIGYKTPEWLRLRGVSIEKIYPFAYFLPPVPKYKLTPRNSNALRLIYVGQLIERKSLDLLIRALSYFSPDTFELTVIGDGPKRSDLVNLANHFSPNRILWKGKMAMGQIPKYIANSDLLILPSKHDGWGAVVSESLLVGTPVICSNACGSAGVVLASGNGGVFPSGNLKALCQLLYSALFFGPIKSVDRTKLRDWSVFLQASEGAQYLIQILTNSSAPPISSMSRLQSSN